MDAYLSRSMAKESRPPARRNGHLGKDPVIRLETGDFEALEIEEVVPSGEAPLPPPVERPRGRKVEQRASPAFDPNSFNPPLSKVNFDAPGPSDTHPIPSQAVSESF
jgi:hypothetical protein